MLLMPLTFKESNLHTLTLIPKTKQNQCRIAEGNNNMKYGYDNSKAPHRVFATFNQVAGK